MVAEISHTIFNYFFNNGSIFFSRSIIEVAAEKLLKNFFRERLKLNGRYLLLLKKGLF